MNNNIEEPVAESDPPSSGFSRRNALKAGIGVGVGIAAWSGPTITSLGGTPVYASHCTFAIDRSISGNDRNTSQANECVSQNGFGFFDVTFSNLPTGFSITPTAFGNVCSTFANPFLLTLTFPTTLKCEIQVEFRSSNGKVLFYVFTDLEQSGTRVVNLNGTTTVQFRLPTGDDIAKARIDLLNGPDDVAGNADDVVEPRGGFFPSDTRFTIFLRCIGANDPEDCFAGPINF